MRLASLSAVLLFLGFVSSCQIHNPEPNEACDLSVSEVLFETVNIKEKIPKSDSK